MEVLAVKKEPNIIEYTFKDIKDNYFLLKDKLLTTMGIIFISFVKCRFK